MTKFKKILILGVVAVVLITTGFFVLNNEEKQEKVNTEVSVEKVVGEIQYIKLKGCSEEVYKDDASRNRNPNYFMCRSYLTDGEFVYYHGFRATPSPIPVLQILSPIVEITSLSPSFIATSSPDLSDDILMGATIIEGADPETFEIMYFDEGTPQVQQNNTFSFARDKDYLYWEGKRFEGVDPNTFAILGRWFIKDKDSVYFKWRKLEGSDSDTFEFLWGGFARDKNFVYRNNPEVEIFKGVDPATFEKIDDNYLKDKNAIYYHQEKIEGSDPTTFEFLYGYTGKDMGKAYAKDKNSVYHLGKRIDGADPETFEFLPNAWSKDKNFVYKYNGTRIDGIDPATVELLSQGYIKDKNGVYYDNGNKKIQGADPETFEVLADRYIRDKDSVWISTYGYEQRTASSIRKIETADAESFEVIEKQYARDIKAVYCSGDVMEGFDWGSVVMLQGSYIRDKNFVFFGCDNIEGADAKSFETLDYLYAKDKISVYYIGKRIDGADSDSFEKLTCDYSKDKNNIYKVVSKDTQQEISKFGNFDASTFRLIGNCSPSDKNGVYTISGEKIEGADPETFEFIGGSYSKDAQHVYWDTTLIEGVDIATFKFNGGGFNGGNFARDKNTVYYKGKVYDEELKASLRETEDNIDFMINPILPPNVIINDLSNTVPVPIYPMGL